MNDKEWKTYKFPDFVLINPTISLKGDGDFSFIEMKDLSEGKRFVEPSAERKVTGGARFQEDDTLFARISPCLENGKIGQAKKLKNGVGFGSTEFLVFRDKLNISNKDYVYYLACWQEVRKFAEQNMIGTSGRQRVNKEAFENLELLLPPLETQTKIASILSSLDEKIELNRQTNQTLEAIAQTLFKEMCLPKSEELPEGWRVGKLGEVCDVNKNSLNKKNDFLAWIDYIEISEVSKGVVNNVTRYDLGEEPSRAKRKLKNGDVVLSTVRPDRGSYFLAINPSKTDIVSTGFAVFSATLVPYSFLYLFLTEENIIKYYGHIANGGAYPAINPNVIMDIELIIPKDDVLEQFHNTVEPLLLKYHLNNKQTQTLISIRDSLLPKLMKGEIGV